MPSVPARAHRVLLAAALFAAACGGPVDEAAAPDVLLVTVDTLRADFLERYAEHGVATPSITRLADRGVLFEHAIAASSATVPSHASMMSSRFARQHSVGPFNGPTRLEGLPTLAEAFRAAGRDTAAFVSNAVLTRRVGLDRGFEVYDDELVAAEANRATVFERTADDTAKRAIAWLEAPREAAFFLWVHLQDPHGPYTPPPPWDEVVSQAPLRTDRPLPVLGVNRGRGGLPAYQALPSLVRPSEYASRYAGEVAFVDRWIGAVVEAAEKASGDRGLIVLFTADHGESLGEDGYFFQHGHATSAELARVPFVVASPGIDPARSRTLVHHVDIAPTLLELAGLPPLDTAVGRSLAPVLRGSAPPQERTVFCDTPGEVSAYRADDRMRVIGPPGPARPDLGGQRAAAFDAGPKALVFESESRDEAGHWHAAEGDDALREALLRYVSDETPVRPALAPSAEQIERLRALGYLPPSS